MADYKLRYSGAEVDEAILDSKKIKEMYDIVQEHLNTHMTNQAREILLSNAGSMFKSNNVEEGMAELYNDVNDVLPIIKDAFVQYEQQVVVSTSEIDTIIANALK